MNKPTTVSLSLHIFKHWLLMVFRYALGRKTGVASDCEEWLTEYWHLLDTWQQKQIHADIRDAIVRGHAGAPCDVARWEGVLKLEIVDDLYTKID